MKEAPQSADEKRFLDIAADAADRLNGNEMIGLPDLNAMEPETVLREFIAPAVKSARYLTGGAHPDSDLILVTLGALWQALRGEPA